MCLFDKTNIKLILSFLVTIFNRSRKLILNELVPIQRFHGCHKGTDRLCPCLKLKDPLLRYLAIYSSFLCDFYKRWRCACLQSIQQWIRKRCHRLDLEVSQFLSTAWTFFLYNLCRSRLLICSMMRHLFARRGMKTPL